MFTIRVAETDVAFPCAAEDTITRAGLRAGIALPYECNTGSCGTCKMELVAGAIESLRPDGPGLADRDRAKRRILGCQAQPRGHCEIKTRIDEVAAGVPRPRETVAALTGAKDVTHDIREFSFEFPAEKPFLPGQYALLHLASVEAPRAYSMSNGAGGRVWQFYIKHVPGGRATGVLFDQLEMGRSVVIDGPYGHAYLRPGRTRDVVCIAGGSGISPALSIARGMADAPSLSGRHLYFFYGGRRPRDLCGEDVLCSLAPLQGRYAYTPVISCPDDEPSRMWTGRTGFVHDAVRETLGSVLPAFEFYFAGPPVMTTAVQRMLMEAKVPINQMHFDQFF